MIEKQVKLNLAAHALWIVNTVVDSTTGTVLEYQQLKLGPDAKQWIQGFFNKVGPLAQDFRREILTGSNTVHVIHP